DEKVTPHSVDRRPLRRERSEVEITAIQVREFGVLKRNAIGAGGNHDVAAAGIKMVGTEIVEVSDRLQAREIDGIVVASLGVKMDYRVLAGARLEDEAVAAGSPVQSVVADAAGKQIAVRVAKELVAANAAEKRVVSVIAMQFIVTIASRRADIKTVNAAR